MQDGSGLQNQHPTALASQFARISLLPAVCFAAGPELGVNASINNCRQLLGQFGTLLRFKCIAVRLICWQTLDSAACTQRRMFWSLPCAQHGSRDSRKTQDQRSGKKNRAPAKRFGAPKVRGE